MSARHEIDSAWCSLRAGDVRSHGPQLPNKVKFYRVGGVSLGGEKIIWYVFWQDMGSILK